MSKINERNFRTQFDRNPVFSEPGTRFKQLYSMSVDEDGTTDLKLTGEVKDLYLEIQSWKESTDVSTIVKRFLNGDTSVLSQRVPLYGDFTNLPKTTAEMLQLVYDTRAAFAELSPEVRSQFNNDPDQFFASVGTDKFNSIFGLGQEVVEDAPVQTVPVSSVE